MEDIKIREDEEYIKLGQLLKKVGIASSGTEAKYIIEDNDILVNGELEKRRGKKLREGDIVDINGVSFRMVRWLFPL